MRMISRKSWKQIRKIMFLLKKNCHIVCTSVLLLSSFICGRLFPDWFELARTYTDTFNKLCIKGYI